MISILITIALTGFIVWLILQIPMPAVFQKVIIGVVALILVLWVLQTLGIHTGYNLRIPR